MKTEQIREQETMPRYDAVVVLGAVMRWDSKLKEWIFPTIMKPEEYSGRLVMGKARAIAASHIAKDADKILVTGGSNVHPETGERASRSKELARLITERYSVPAEKVIAIGTLKASTIIGNVENVINYLEQHTASLKTRHIAILCPQFQYERAKLMFDKSKYFAEHGIHIDWKIVEDVLTQRNPRYRIWAKAVDATPEAEIARNMEQSGIGDLKSGTYNPKQ